ncbi:unnamed protein product [Prunus brigantina]
MIYGVNEMITEMVLRRLENHGSKYNLLRGRLLLSIYRRSPGGTIEAEKICVVEPNRGKWVVKSAFGIVKHGGMTPINPVGARAERKSLRSVYDRDLLGTNIAPTSLDSSVAAWAGVGRRIKCASTSCRPSLPRLARGVASFRQIKQRPLGFQHVITVITLSNTLPDRYVS